MAYTYPLGIQFASEVFGMWIVITIALSAVANHVLTNTTGHGMGYFAVATAFGLAFAFPLTAFGSVSAVLNPAAAAMLWTNGTLDGYQFLVVSLGDLLGAFIGGLTVYMFYAPQLHKAGATCFRIRDYLRVMETPSRDLSENAKVQNDCPVLTVSNVSDEHASAPGLFEKVLDKPLELVDEDDAYLGIWVTRPSVWAPVHSFMAELTSTFIFLFLVQTLSIRGKYVPSTYGVAALYSNVILPVLVGAIVGTMVLIMGPTGFSGNPARDLGPRLAHWLLPVPKNKKVGSEWRYAWIPVVAPFLGGVLSGLVFNAWEDVLKGQAP